MLRYIAQARARGIAVIFITHNVHHAYPIGDRFTILNRGTSYGTFLKQDVTREQVVEMMAGGQELEELGHELEEFARVDNLSSDVARAGESIAAEGTARVPPANSRSLVDAFFFGLWCVPRRRVEWGDSLRRGCPSTSDGMTDSEEVSRLRWGWRGGEEVSRLRLGMTGWAVCFLRGESCKRTRGPSVRLGMTVGGGMTRDEWVAGEQEFPI